MLPVNILVEGLTDESVARRLVAYVGLEVGRVFGANGKAYLLKRLADCNKAAQFSPWFVLIDLDNDKHCPSEALQIWLPQPAQGMRCRIAVRAIESWLLADSEHLAHYLSIPEAKIRVLTDTYPNPKEALINLARRSRHSDIRHDMIPAQNDGMSIGPSYATRLDEFTKHYWDPARAAEHSKSLQHCISALETLVDRESS